MKPARGRWGAIWTVSALVMMGVVIAVILVASQRAQAARAAASADGFSLEIAELAPPELPSARNAALVLAPLIERSERGQALLGTARTWTPAVEGASDEVLAALAAVEAGGRARAGAVETAELALRRGEQPPAAEVVLLRAFLREAEHELALVARAAECSGWRFDLPQYHGGWGRTARRPLFLFLGVNSTLVARALLQLDDGDPEGAADSLRQALYVARATADEPTLVSASAHLSCLRIALDGLRRALPRIEAGIDLSSLERELAACDVRRSMRLAFAGERAFNRWFLRDVAAGGPGPGAGAASLLRKPTLRGALIRVPLIADLHESEVLGYWSEAIALAGRPQYEIHDETAALDRRAQDPPWQASLVPLGIPVGRRLELAAEVEAEVLLAELALLAYRAGSAAAELAADAAIDPLSGAPVRHQRDADGALLLACDADPMADALAAEEQLAWRVP